MLSLENGSVKELDRIETESVLVKEGAFSAAYAVAVATEALGVTIKSHRFGTSARLQISLPIPVAAAVPPPKKNGTSAPNPLPICLKSPSLFKRQRRFNANSVIAAFDDPPPKPPLAGIFFKSLMSAPPACPRDNAALTIKLVSSTGIDGSSHVNTMRSSSRNSNTISSHRETLCRTVATS